MRVVVFDLIPHGHHPRWVREFVEALQPRAEVIACLSGGLVQQVDGIHATVRSLDEDLPGIDDELDAFDDLASVTGADHAIHLSATRAVLRRWLRRRPGRTPATILVSSPAALHYPSVYHTPLSLPERANAHYKEHLVASWRRRPDSHAVFTLDEAVVERWSRRPGAPAFFLPEPPVEAPADARSSGRRSGCIMYGHFTARKGLALLADALSLAPAPLQVVLAGSVEESYAPALDRAVERMRSAGATVDTRLDVTAETGGLAALARARCAVIPYIRHKGTSRVLVEAATVGTPVVAHEAGMLGHLVRSNDLGLVVDCTRPELLRRAVLSLLEVGARQRYSENLARFAAGFTADAFQRAVWSPFEGSSRETTGRVVERSHG